MFLHLTPEGKYSKFSKSIKKWFLTFSQDVDIISVHEGKRMKPHVRGILPILKLSPLLCYCTVHLNIRLRLGIQFNGQVLSICL